MSQSFLSPSQSVCFFWRGLSSWDKGWHRLCHRQISFQKGLAVKSCAQALASKKQDIRLNTPNGFPSSLIWINVIFIWRIFILQDFSAKLFWGNSTSLLFPCLDILLEKKKHATTSEMFIPALKRCFLTVKIWIPICPYLSMVSSSGHGSSLGSHRSIGLHEFGESLGRSLSKGFMWCCQNNNKKYSGFNSNLAVMVIQGGDQKTSDPPCYSCQALFTCSSLKEGISSSVLPWTKLHFKVALCCEMKLR